jgi:hypothetical protein
MTVQYVWMYASNATPGQQTTTMNTVSGIPRGTNVFATVSLSFFTEGVSASGVGAAGAVIPHWGVFNANGSITAMSNVNLNSNALVINNCAYVTFELVANDAGAYAQGSVFYL